MTETAKSDITPSCVSCFGIEDIKKTKTDNQIKKIIFIFESPFNERIYERFGIELLISKGLEVEVWDFTPYIHKSIYTRLDPEDPFPYRNYRRFETKKEIFRAISRIQPDVIFNCFIGFQLRTYFIYLLLSIKGIKYCAPMMVSFPSPTYIEKKSLKESIISLLQKIVSITILSNFLNPILFRYYYIFGIKPSDFAIFSGQKSIHRDEFPVGEKTRKILAHTFDYDIALKIKSLQTPSNPSTCIFLDEYFPLHSDLLYIKCSSPISAEEYYPKICAFFDFLEENYHIKIIIAAHPKSQYENTNFFGDRLIVKDQTSSLVKKSSFVIAHDSTSINFAVLFRKPILFITMNKFEDPIPGIFLPGPIITSIANSLKREPVNIDKIKNFNLKDELVMDEQAYQQYQNDYIKIEGSPDLPLWEIYIQNIKPDN